MDLMLHSIVRWLVLVAGVAATVLAFQLSRGQPWTPLHKRVNLAFLIATDTQFLLGALLWLQSPLVQAARADMKTAMHDPVLRFFTVEHPTLMLVSLALMHIGYSKAKKAAGDAKKYQAAFILFASSLAVMLAGVPWPFRMAGRALWP